MIILMLIWVFLSSRFSNQFTFSVTTCEHATIALNLLQNGGYDVVLTDVHMPDMDGFKLLEIIGLGMDLPVVSESHYSNTCATCLFYVYFNF